MSEAWHSVQTCPACGQVHNLECWTEAHPVRTGGDPFLCPVCNRDSHEHYANQETITPQSKSEIPDSVWVEVYELSYVLADLQRALINRDDTYIVKDLYELSKHRDQLVRLLQTWNPELRIWA